MHELAICQSLIGEVARVAATRAGAKVVTVSVAIGPLSGVEAPLLARAFTVARAGTIAAEASLEIEAKPVTVRCRACDVEAEAAPNALLCPQCGGWQVDVMSGDELLLTRVELECETETA